MIYVIYFADLGTPKTGLSPTIDIFIKVSDGSSAGTPPSITELSGGYYKFSYAPTEDICIRIDSEDSNMADRDRYIVSVVSPYDTGLENIKAVTDNLPNSGALTTLITHLTDIKGTGWTDENLKTMDALIDNIKAQVDADAVKITKLLKIGEGRWKMVGNQFIIYDSDGVTPLLTFDLKNALGEGAMKDVTERVPS